MISRISIPEVFIAVIQQSIYARDNFSTIHDWVPSEVNNVKLYKRFVKFHFNCISEL